MRRPIAVVVAAAALGGCAGPGPYLSCEDVPATECEAAHEEAVANGLFRAPLIVSVGRTVGGGLVVCTY